MIFTGFKWDAENSDLLVLEFDATTHIWWEVVDGSYFVPGDGHDVDEYRSV
jgi:hypothetical protein